MFEPRLRGLLRCVEAEVIRQLRQLAESLVVLLSRTLLHGSGDPVAVPGADHLAKAQIAALADSMPVRLAARLEPVAR